MSPAEPFSHRWLRTHRILALLVLLAMVVHTYFKWKWGTLPELLFVALAPISHYLRPARFNVNMAHERLWLLLRHFPGNWDYRFAFSAIMLSLMLLMDLLFARVLGRPGRSGALS